MLEADPHILQGMVMRLAWGGTRKWDGSPGFMVGVYDSEMASWEETG